MLQHDSQAPDSQGVTGVSDFVPPIGALDEFALEPGCSSGVALDELEPGTQVVVGTRHSCYRLTVNDGLRGRVTVVGGTVFPEPAEVRVDGATAGGSVIKAGWIGVGLRMEMSAGLKRITTSTVKFLAIENPPAPSAD